LATHLLIGVYGEEFAAEWLIANGFSVLHRNWRYGRKEIDIIAAKDGTLHIIEIKTRRTIDFGPPETQVNRRKIKHLKEAAAGFLEEHPQWRKIQFDVLAITLGTNQPSVLLLEDIS
jgi:putative endonuclease